MNVSAADALAELKREAAQRQRVFPRWVADGRLQEREAHLRQARLARAIAIVEAAAAAETPVLL